MSFILDFAPAHSETIDAELKLLLTTPQSKWEVGRLLAVVAELLEQETFEGDRNIGLSTTDPKLYRVIIRSCVVYYTYGTVRGRPALILLGFCRTSVYLQQLPTFADRIRTLPRGSLDG